MSRRCETCAMNFIDEYSFHGHLLGKKHAKNLELMKQKIQRQQNSIFVSPVPPFATPQMVRDFFAHFGPLQHYTFNPRYLIIEYKYRNPVDYLLSNPIYMNQWKLNIRRRKIDTTHGRKREGSNKSPEKQKSEQESQEEIEAADTLRVQLEAEKTFDDQVTKFMNLVQPDEKHLQSLNAIVCTSLDKTLRASFPKCQAIPFGSSITGLALVGSDLDVFLDIGEPIFEDDKGDPGKRTGWTPKTIFREVKSLLFKNQSTFTKIIPIPMAKIPVIKFRHVPTKVDCDISFKHGLGIYNSQLIKYLLTLDSRIKTLTVIIKYWGKKMDLSGSGKITNYSLVMLIIFYLQQPTVNLLPTVKDLQQSSEPVYNSGWKVNFDRNYPCTSSRNSSSISELLCGFFKFYAEFDFTTRIICPLDGQSYCRIDFKKGVEERNEDIENLHLTKPACLQDPIQLDRNIVSGWSIRHLQALQCSCQQAAETCLSSKESPTALLPGLFNPILKCKTKKAKSIVFAVPAGKFERFGLPDDFDDQEDIENKQKFIETNWFCTIYKLLKMILERIFKFEIQVIYDTAGMKQIKLEEESDVHTKDHDKIMLSCKGKYCLNRSRKGVVPTLDPSMSPIEKEIMISDKVLKDLQERKEEIPIKFTCVIEKRTNPLQAFLTLTDQQFTNKSFTEITTYMRSKIPCIVDKELMHMVQFNKKPE